MLNCGEQEMQQRASPDATQSHQKEYLHIPVRAAKQDKCGLERVLGEALAFAGEQLAMGRRLAVVCEVRQMFGSPP